MKHTITTIMRSSRLDMDFELLLRTRTLWDILDDGFILGEDEAQYNDKRTLLATRYQDFLDIIRFLGERDLVITRRLNRNWGTTEKVLRSAEAELGRTLSHGALMLALDLRGIGLEQIDGQKDAYMTISKRTKI